jgi:DNA-binding NarL/FixJ family response regulator
MSQKRAKVFIVDDYPQMGTSLRKLLEYEQDFEVCGEADDVESAAKGIRECRPDVAIVDLVLGRETGVQLLVRLSGQLKKLPILILTMLPEHLNAKFLLEKGAKGYLMKSESPDQILYALRRVVSGKTYLSPAMELHLQRKGDHSHE